MSPFVEYLKRNYAAGKTTKAKLDDYLAKANITQEEYNYITE